MLRFVTYLLLAVAASSAEDLQSGYVCLIDEPNEVQQCENLCLNRLKPLPNKISQRQNHNGNGKNQAKLDQLEIKMGEQLKDMREKLEDQLSGLERNQLAMQTTLKGQQAILSKMENQLEALLKIMNFTKEADKVEKGAEEKPAEEKVPPMEDGFDFDAIFVKEKPAEEKVPPMEDDFNFDAIFPPPRNT